jgi:hypothetical protein
MGFGILKTQLSIFVARRIQTGPVTRMIGNQSPGLANFLVGPWCVDHLRSKIAYLSPLLMAHKYRGCIVVLLINKSVEPNEEQKALTSSFYQGFTANTSKQVFRGT